jgi:putative membrane protein
MVYLARVSSTATLTILTCKIRDELVKRAVHHSGLRWIDHHKALLSIALSSPLVWNEAVTMAPRAACTLIVAAVLVAGASGSTSALGNDVSSTIPAVSAADSQFSSKAAASGLAEVQLGKLALEKSSNKNVKQLAQRMLDDHGKADNQLAIIAKQKDLALPAKPDADATKAYAKLDKKSGQAFDQAWSKVIIKDHQAAVKLFSSESSQGKDAELRKFAAATLPTLQAHLKSAQQIAAVPDARDKAMDSTMKTMSAGDIDAPAAAASTPLPTATATPTTPTTVAARAASPVPAESSPSSSVPPAKKH